MEFKRKVEVDREMEDTESDYKAATYTAREVMETFESVATDHGPIMVTKGNYILTPDNGRLPFGVHPTDLELYYVAI